MLTEKPMYLVKSCSMVNPNLNGVFYTKEDLQAFMLKHRGKQVSFKLIHVPTNQKLQGVKFTHYPEKGKHKFILNDPEHPLTFTKFFNTYYM